MNFLALLKKFIPKFGFVSKVHFTPTSVLMIGTILMILCLIAVLGWDGSLFLQSISPIESLAGATSRQISLTSNDVDDAITILNARNNQFNALVHQIAATTTISF